jgi:hypothetical protein
VAIAGGTLKVKNGIALIKLSAPAGASRNSSGSLALRTANAVRLAGLKVTLELGRARYQIAPGASSTLRVKLAKGTRKLANRQGRLKVRALATTGPSGNSAQSSRRITLALGKAT